MSEKLFESQNWSATKDVLLEGLNGNRKAVMEAVLENTKKNIMNLLAQVPHKAVTSLFLTR
jgi:hypothetical protein